MEVEFAALEAINIFPLGLDFLLSRKDVSAVFRDSVSLSLGQKRCFNSIYDQVTSWRIWQSIRWTKNANHLTQVAGSLSFSNEPPTRSCTQPLQSSPAFPIQLFKIKLQSYAVSIYLSTIL